MRRALPLLVCLAFSCRTISVREVSSSPSPRVRSGALARAWEVRSESETLGLVVQFQEWGGVRDSLYVVRNTWHQDLGLIDGLGRAFRYIPHREEPVWVGSGTVLSGAQRILGTSSPCRLLEVTDPLHPPASGAAPLAAPGPAPRPSEDAPAALAIHGPRDGLPQSR